MNHRPANRAALLLPFGIIVYLLDVFCVPYFGMLACQIISAGLLLVMLVAYMYISGKETDERERLIQLQSDSAALYAVIAGLLAAAIFYPHSEAAMTFWLVLGVAVAGRIIFFIYQRIK